MALRTRLCKHTYIHTYIHGSTWTEAARRVYVTPLSRPGGPGGESAQQHPRTHLCLHAADTHLCSSCKHTDASSTTGCGFGGAGRGWGPASGERGLVRRLRVAHDQLHRHDVSLLHSSSAVPCPQHGQRGDSSRCVLAAGWNECDRVRDIGPRVVWVVIWIPGLGWGGVGHGCGVPMRCNCHCGIRSYLYGRSE